MRSSLHKTKHIFFVIAIVAFLTVSVGIAFPQAAPLPKALATFTLMTATPSPTSTSTPNWSDAITNAEKSIFDPILALLNFAAAFTLAILVFFLLQRFLSLVRKTNLVVDPFNDATGDDNFSKMTGGLYQVARECLVDEINELQKRIKENINIGPGGYQLPNKSPVPQGTTDTQMSDLLKSLKDATSGEVSTAVQLMSLVFVPQGTRVTSTLHCLDNGHPRAAFSFEVIDLGGRQEPVIYTIREPLIPDTAQKAPSSDTTQKAPTLGESYYKMLPVVMRWLAIELARRNMIAQAPRVPQKNKHYLTQVYNFIGAFYEASGQSYPDYPFFYDLAQHDFQQAIEFDKYWYQPYENLADIYSLMGQANQAKAKEYFSLSLSYYNRALSNLSNTRNGTNQDKQAKENIKRRIEIGQAITQARTDDSKLVSEAFQHIEQIRQNWKDIDSTKDDNLLYNLGSCYALILSQSQEATTIAKARKNAFIYLTYGLVREYQHHDKAGDLWNWVPQDTDFSSIHDKLSDLLTILQQKLDMDPALAQKTGSVFATAITETLKSAQLIP